MSNISSSLEKDIKVLSTKKEDSMLDVIIRLGKWRGVGIGLFYFLISLSIFVYGVYSLVRYKEAIGIVVDSNISPKALQTFFGTSIVSYETTIEFPISDNVFHQDKISTNIQYTKGSEINILYDTQTFSSQISNQKYSWIATIIGIIGMLGSIIYMLLSWRSRAFQTTVGLYGSLLG